MCDIHVGLLTNWYKNGNLAQMCGVCLENVDIYGNLPDCHQCGLICSADDVVQEAKLVLCAYFSKLQKL